MKVKVSHWPVEDGRYKVGNPQSSIAVCTEATVEGIEVDLKKVAIIGKCVTENIGIEKVVKNIVSNPNIRFLILCGKQSRGHDVGQTLISLRDHGLNKDRRVIGSTGSIPVMKNLKSDEVQRFRKQILPIDLQGITDQNKINFKIEQLLRQDPGAFTGKPMKIKKLKQAKVIKCLRAKPNEKFISDPLGSFQISLDQKEKLIICQHYDHDLELDVQVTGQDAIAICDTVCRLNLIGKFSENNVHAAYLGRELEKAEIALENGLEYKQDIPLEIRKKELGGSDKKEDEFGW